ncbi:glycosyl hydrolase 2 galactose-binding domain-containing protein [Fodinicola acaciae]|uniref:glycosyl hydrolase 2 galactose-binding domain-containing protein n=1 Tax=Fodinicola acaciae TaxID=2681555 RepID=UPI0013D814BD|nr:sugar-binding domain-containing protein [Fodinicola acaciae]
MGLLPAAAWGTNTSGADTVLGSATGTTELTKGWTVQSSAVAKETGDQVSLPGYSTAGWLKLSKPETLMAALLENGRYPDIFYSNNLTSVPTAQFDVNWWYRNQLTVHPRPGQHTYLIMNGISGRANLWVNGKKVADQAQLQGSYSQLEYDITSLVTNGSNAIALDVYKNDDSKYLTSGTIDWNPKAPDRNTGLVFAPQLAQDGAISVRDTHVLQDNAKDLSTSDLTVKTNLRNNADTAQTATFAGTISRPGTRIPFAKKVTVPAGKTVTVTVTKADAPGLHIVRPAVWWPYQMGDQPLYHLDSNAFANGERADGYSTDFGIRTVTSYLTKVVPGKTHGPYGYRQFVINGVPFVIRGGGWSPDMFLRYSAQNIADQISYIKNLGLNTLRFEGNFTPDDMLRQMDRAGLLAMEGWQCCDRWEDPSKTWPAELKANAANQAFHVAQMLRDHPSVFTFYHGSDNEPDADKEAIYLTAFTAADWQTPQIASAEYKSSAKLGPSGSKEGPYNYVPPNYWWANGTQTKPTDDDTFTNAGSAYGLDTESSAGNTIPTTNSLNRFLSSADQDKIWDLSSTNGGGSGPDIFHVYKYNNYTKTGRLGQYNTPLWNRYGKWSDLASYQRIAQVGEYEIARAQFEAYLGNSKDEANPSTGLIYWMMNKAWPSLQWNIYGYDFDQSGVYFGTKKAGEPVHVMYGYDDGSIRVANLTNDRQSGLTATAKFIDINGKVQGTSQAAVPALFSQDVRTVLMPKVPAGISKTYFLELTLTRGHAVVSRNVYWLSTKKDDIDWKKTLGEGFGVTYGSGGYADLTGLQNLGKATVKAAAHTRIEGRDAVTTVTIRNVSGDRTPAFFTRADVLRANVSGDNQVLPIQWSDNEVTLWPGQRQTITARYRLSELKGASPLVSLSGWNIGNQTVRAR